MRKIIFLMFIAVFGLMNLNAAVSDTILDVTYNTSYIESQGWNTWNKIPTDVSLPTGFGYILNVDDSTKNIMQVNNVNGKSIWLGGVDRIKDDFWLTDTIAGLVVGAQYEITSSITLSGSSTCISLGAWETDSTPGTREVFDNQATSNADIFTTIVTATANTMVFGIGTGATNQAANDHYARNVLNNWLIVKKAPEYDINYHNVGSRNSESNPATYTEAAGVASLANPNDSTGYTFAGWYTDAGLSSAVASPVIPTGETTTKDFYAKWEAAATYTVTYDANGGVVDTTSEVVNEGANPLLVATATRSGYEFVEWNTQADSLGDQFTTSSVVNANITVYAQWKFIPLLDTILDETYNSDYFTSIGWTGNGYVDPAGSGLPNALEDGYDAYTDVALNSGNILYYAAPRLYTRGNFGNDVWVTFDATGLEVGAEYQIIAQLTAQVSKTTQVNERSSATLGAWEDGSAPVVTGNYISLNDPLLPYTTFVEAGDTADMDTIITATANSMVFGIGVGGNTRAYHSQGLYINSWSIIKKKADQGIPTNLNNIEEASFTLYPNPTNDILNIKGLDEGTRIELYSTSGILVKTSLNSTVDVSDLSQGIYYVKAGSQVKAFAKQ